MQKPCYGAAKATHVALLPEALESLESQAFLRPGGFLCLADADLAEWPGEERKAAKGKLMEAVATSTSRNLEGTLRRNW